MNAVAAKTFALAHLNTARDLNLDLASLAAQIDAAHRARVPHEALTLTYNKMRAERDLQIRAAHAWRV